MRRQAVLAIVVAVITCSAFTSAATAETHRVGLWACATWGATYQFPAGTNVELGGVYWVAKNRGLVVSAIEGSELTTTVNGAPIAGDWRVWPLQDIGWMGGWTAELGPLTAPLEIYVDWSLSHSIPDLLTWNDDGTPYLFSGTLFAGRCRIVPT